MEYSEALQLLRDRLDENLKQHAGAAHTDEIGDIYRLQAYSETHYYMKAVHDYTSAEIEALLSFVDPLEVAFWCREENTHDVGLPICDILKEIHADERFPKKAPELSFDDKVRTLVIRLGKNLYDFQEKLKTWSKQELIDHCGEIAAKMAAYQYMSEEFAGNPSDGIADYLLQYENPLSILAEYWPEGTLFGPDVIADIQDAAKEQRKSREQPKSVHERLKEASRSVQDKITSEKTQRSTGAR